MLLVLTLISICFILAIFFDLTTMKIPNKLCLVFIVIGLALNMALTGWQGLGYSLLAICLMFVLLFPLFAFRLLGAGDVKLMMAVAALSGPTIALWSLAWGIIAGTLLAILLGARKAGLTGVRKTFTRYWHCLYLRRYFKPDSDELASQPVPYAPALAVGFVITCYLDPALRGAVTALFL